MTAAALPIPRLGAHPSGRLPLLTDDALAASCGVRVAFTGRAGGTSAPPFDALNLGDHVGDDPAAVAANRNALLEAVGAAGAYLIVPRQVHGTDLATVDDPSPAALDAARARAEAGVDGVVVSVPQVAALLCFADCVPVVVVAPSGAFAVAHAGWRGALGRVASKAVRALAAARLRGEGANGPSPEELRAVAATCNAYIGPCIRSECFEVDPDVARRFADEFGAACLSDATHVDLASAVASDLSSAGIERARIADAGVCTTCAPQAYYSYRASGGACGRHGALAVRPHGKEGEGAHGHPGSL